MLTAQLLKTSLIRAPTSARAVQCVKSLNVRRAQQSASISHLALRRTAGNARNNAQLQTRSLSDKAPGGSAGPAGPEKPVDALVLTPYQKVAAATNASLWLGAAGLSLVCGYFIVKELFPFRMNPNSLFNEAVDQLVNDSKITSRLGTPIRGYGKDHGRRREGRRNFIEHVELKDKNGNDRLRIKFNLKGPYGHGFGFAEVRKGMSKGEWVYLIVQLTSSGEVITIQDNRQILEAESPEEQDALRALLGGK